MASRSNVNSCKDQKRIKRLVDCTTKDKLERTPLLHDAHVVMNPKDKIAPNATSKASIPQGKQSEQ